jgi:hypothetical protein
MSDSSIPPDDDLPELPRELAEQLAEIPTIAGEDVDPRSLTVEQAEEARAALAEENAIALLTLQANGVVAPTDVVYLKVMLEALIGPWEIARIRLIYERAIRDAIPGWRAVGEAQRDEMVRSQLLGNRQQRRGR